MPSKAVKSYVASDGKHYWNGWTGAYRVQHGTHMTHAFCDEDKTVRSLCGVEIAEGGGLSIPSETKPGCLKCYRILIKRGITL